MMRNLIFMLVLIYPFITKAQDGLTILDSTFKYYYIDEKKPLPFSPDNYLTFGLQDTSEVVIVMHKIIPGPDSSVCNYSIPVDTILNRSLPGGKYKIFWKNRKQYFLKKDEAFEYCLYAYRKTEAILGNGHIKFEGKCKVIYPD